MITVSSRTMKGNRTPGVNRLPLFRSAEHSQHLNVSMLTQEEQEGYGYETGFRVLPYLMQDEFSRQREEISIKTVILENDHLRAEFWPDYGFRLMSLVRKDFGRELLFSNSCLQFADLAIRKAWFSGGIEWNLGQLGHAFTTCEPLFAAVVETGTGSFLRCWEYERCKRLYWSIDFHLDDGDDFLSVYLRVVNPLKEAVPFYYWTNTAVPEEPDARIYSGSDDIIYIDQASLASGARERLMAHGSLPYIDRIAPDRDFSYPSSFPYSNEYFFQNRRSLDQTWEAVSYSDGWTFLERSSERLCYRKMFCWGTNQGGRHWESFLSPEGDGRYVEVQAGFARTQMHGFDIPAGTQWDFVQFFTGEKYSSSFSGEWKSERSRIYSLLDEKIPSSLVKERLSLYRKMAGQPVSQLIHQGSGWGALENLRDEKACPEGFFFPSSSLTEEQESWIRLLKEGRVEETGDDELPLSYMSDMRWHDCLEKASEGSVTALNLLGIMLFENGRFAEAQEKFEKALSIRPSALTLRNLSQCALCRGDRQSALEYMRRCCALSEKREFVQEYIEMLPAGEAFAFYSSLGKELRNNERIMHAVLPAAIERLDYDFLARIYSAEPAVIREGNRAYSDGWFVYEALRKAREEGRVFSPELVEECRKEDRLPFFADFRQG